MPDIGRFNRPDRFSEKYFDKSTYSYAANNPILYVDVKGDSIKVSFRTGFLGLFGKKVHLTYDNNNQRWNNGNGTAYTGKTSKFAQRALSDLNQNQQIIEGQTLVGNLATDDKQHYIVKGDPNSNTINDPNIYYSGDSNQSMPLESGKNVKTPGYIVLGHEMAHKFSKNMGVVNALWIGSSVNDPSARGVDETNAMHYENLLRVHGGLPRRVAYDTMENGSVYEPSRFLFGPNLEERYPSNLNIITSNLYYIPLMLMIYR